MKYSIGFGLIGGLMSGPMGWVVTLLGIAIDVKDKHDTNVMNKQIMDIVGKSPALQRILMEEIKKAK